jgi:hypothetical protein
MRSDNQESIGWLILIPLALAFLAAWGALWAISEVGSHLAPIVHRIALVGL